MSTAVVFDGTSHFILPSDEVDEGEDTIINTYNSEEKAQEKADELNEMWCKG